jgi:hypothetical protein
MRLDDEADAGGLEARGQFMPRLPAEDQAKMGNGNLVAIDGIGHFLRGIGTPAPGREMGDDLVAMEIEIDPMRVGAAFGATEKAAVKISRGGEIIDRESEMKSWHP